MRLIRSYKIRGNRTDLCVQPVSLNHESQSFYMSASSNGEEGETSKEKSEDKNLRLSPSLLHTLHANGGYTFSTHPREMSTWKIFLMTATVTATVTCSAFATQITYNLWACANIIEWFKWIKTFQISVSVCNSPEKLMVPLTSNFIKLIYHCNIDIVHTRRVKILKNKNT